MNSISPTLAAAIARAKARVQRDAAPPPQPHQAAPPGTNAPQASAAADTQPAANRATADARQPQRGHASDTPNEGDGTERPATAEIDVADRTPAGIAAWMRSQSRNKHAAAMLSDAQLYAIFSAMMDGAAKAGAGGTADRQAVFRALGLPWFSAPFSKTPGADGGGKGDLAARLEAASQRARAASRRAPVTREDDDAADPAADRDFEGDAHKIEDHATVTFDDDDDAAPPSIGAALGFDDK